MEHAPASAYRRLDGCSLVAFLTSALVAVAEVLCNILTGGGLLLVTA